MWGIWRFKPVISKSGPTQSCGEWVEETNTGDMLIFNTEAEAKKLAGVWNATHSGWVYIARPYGY